MEKSFSPQSMEAITLVPVRNGLAQLAVICASVGECRKKTYYTSGLIPIRQKPVKIRRNTAHKYLRG
jgi:hypothetical protein